MIYNARDIELIGEKDFTAQVVRISWVILFLGILFQLIFFAEITNIIAMTAVVFAWLITTKIWFRKKMLETYLLSTFTIIGFASSQFFFPLLFTTIENKPLVYNLELPEQVFLHSTACLLILVIAHGIYRSLMETSPNRSFSILGKAGFFDPPTHLQLWIMGMFGMASSFYVYFTNPEIGQEITGSASDKLLAGLVPFTYAPFFIPIAKLYGNNQKLPRGFGLMILVYAVLLFAISMARNSRGAFIFGLTTPAFAYGLGLLLGVFKTKVFSVRNFAVVGVVVWLLMGPFTDLGTAMLIVRGTRTDIPPAELIASTLEALDDKKAIEARKAEDKNESMDFDWDERYLDNIFTARFANIKFNDSNLITYSKVGQFDPDMQDYSLDQLLATLPDPIIKLFNLDVDKDLVLALSFGDYMYVVSGGYGTPNGYRVGHVAGTGMATFGWWYLALFGLVLIPIFYLNDKFFRRKPGLDPATVPPEERFQFSFCGVLALTTFFQFLLFESVVSGATYLIRGWIQLVVLYMLMFHSSRLISNVIAGRRQRARVSLN
ncbi:MAG TPA: hypothetical protein VFD46_14395 [Chryseolinea sp.]|jgi:hypothetical protein|nr:hypothetical protein [Chryseolinea sp.]